MVEIKNILVLGTGLMGNGIGQVALMAGYNVILVDIVEEALNKAAAEIEGGLKKLEAKGKLGEGKTAADVMTKCSKSTDLASAVKNADIVIEAVIEKMSVKKDVCKTTMDNGPAHVIFASNTSTMSITDIGKDCGAPERVCGMHFFNPVPLMRCIEVIKSADTSDDTFNAAMDVANKLPCLRGKRYIAPVLKDRPGFIVNRMNAPVQIYMSYLFDKAAEQGITWEQIDADGGDLMPMGPCELADYVGIDTMHHVMEYYAETLSPDFKPGKVISEMVAAGNLGRKTGKGFFDWSGGRPKIDKSKKAGLFNLENTMAILLNEGCRILEEGVATGFKVIDDANMAGMNTPGPFSAGKKNYEKWAGLLEKLATETGKEYLRPCELMKSGGFAKMRK
ncbi:MAG: 3-hydroxyacyl-CoA dehydrogenase family protein [Promethearchaeota archaeon]|nr:MAG: 3-hydroxyacyl-CoA dehydrogenase family protein [Candidatus Lokiarchaeota archaeon]